jgi:hypothetical protein
MAAGQLNYLQLCNRVLMRLGKSQVAQAGFAALTGDTWGGIIKDSVNDAQQEIYKEHDWSTLTTVDTFTGSARTKDLSVGNFASFGREISLVDTTSNIVLEPVTLRRLHEMDPGQDNSGTPYYYSIQYPTLTFDRVPSSVAYSFTWVARPDTLSSYADNSQLPEFCDMAIIWWVVWQMQASREDAQDGGEGARGIYQGTLARAIGQDRRRMDQIMVLGSAFPGQRRSIVPFPSHYPATYP